MEGAVATREASLRVQFEGKARMRIALEAGTHSAWISRLLGELGHEVIVANPRKVRLISGSDSKNDPADARTLGQFVSWLALCPGNDITGGRVAWRGMRRVHNRAGELLRMAAYSLHHDKSPLGDYLRRMKSKLGPAGATTATAHKIAIIFYTMVKRQVEYDATLWAERDTQREKRFEAKLKRQAHQLGYKLIPIEEKPAA